MKCKESSRIISKEIERQFRRFITTRIIQSYLKNSKYFGKDWKNVCKKLPIDNLKEFSILVKEFYHVFPKRLEQSLSPMHVVVERGDFEFCKLIAKTNAVKSFFSQDEWMPIHFAAQAGNFEVFKFLSKDIKHKNPRTDNGLSLLHLAAKNGHMEIFQFTSESGNEKNPSMDKGITPLHLAAQNGHFDICKHICDNVMNVSPRRSDGSSPLNLAVHRFHLKIAILLIKSDVDNIRADIFTFYLSLIVLGILHICLILLYSTINQICPISNSFCDGINYEDEENQICTISNYFCDGIEYEYNKIDELKDLGPIMSSVYIIVVACVIAPMLLFLFRLRKDIWFCYWKSPILDH